VEARTLAAAVALAFLIGLGAGWQLMPGRQAAPTLVVTEVGAVTVTAAGATLVRTVTSLVYAAAGTVTEFVTVTVTVPPVAAPRILSPYATLECGEGGTLLRIHFILANAGSGSIYANVSGISHGLLGVEELERLSSPYLPPGLAEAGPQEALISLSFAVADLEGFSRLVEPPAEGFTLHSLRAGIEVPYLWEGGSGALRLEAVPLRVSEDCQLPIK